MCIRDSSYWSTFFVFSGLKARPVRPVKYLKEHLIKQLCKYGTEGKVKGINTMKYIIE